VNLSSQQSKNIKSTKLKENINNDNIIGYLKDFKS